MTGPVRVLVTGGRDLTDVLLVHRTLDQFEISALCHGDVAGADQLAEHYGRYRGLTPERHTADWKTCTPDCQPGHRRTRPDGTSYCPAAGPRRNRMMLDMFKPDLVVAFPGGKGTADMVGYARASKAAGSWSGEILVVAHCEK